MKHLLKTLPLACTLLLTAGTCQSLRAQSADADTTDDTPLFFYPTPIIALYEGTVTQTSATGVVSKGTFEVGVDAKGRLAGSMTLNGVNSSLTGALARNRDGERGKTGTGFVRLADSQLHRIAGSPKLPLVVTDAAVTGGSVDEAGVTTVFRATKADPILIPGAFHKIPH